MNRPPAPRAAIAELLASHEYTKTGDKTKPNQLHTPFRDISRVVVGGCVSSGPWDNRDKNSQDVTITLQDLTGAVRVRVGKYAGEGMQERLLEVNEGDQLLVIGKPQGFQTDDGLLVSIQPEALRRIDLDENRNLTIECLKETLEALQGKEVPDDVRHNVIAALEQLGLRDPPTAPVAQAQAKEPVTEEPEAASAPETVQEPSSTPVSPEEPVTSSPEAAPEAPAQATEAKPAAKDADPDQDTMDAITAFVKDKGEAQWDDILEAVPGATADIMDKTITAGDLYEPTLGVIKPV